MPFARGRSGNAAGRPLGAVNKLTREGRRIAGKEGSTIIKKIAENARNGDAHAQRLFMTFLYPRVQFIDSQEERARSPPYKRPLSGSPTRWRAWRRGRSALTRRKP